MHAGLRTSFLVSESGELSAWGLGGGLAGPGRVEALCSVKVRSLGGNAGLVAVATNAETDDEEFYTRDRTCVYISEDVPDGPFLEPRRFELGPR